MPSRITTLTLETNGQVRPNPASIIAPLEELDFFLSLAQPLPHPMTAWEVWAKANASLPWWSRFILKVRNLVLLPFGTKPFKPTEMDIDYPPKKGAKIGSFTVETISDHKLCLIVDDKVRRGMLCVTMSADQEDVVLTGSAILHKRYMRWYIVIFGKMIIRIIRSAAARF